MPVMKFTGEHISLMYAKSMLKLLMITFVAIEAFRFHIFIPLIIFFIAYFTMPGKYKTSEPYKAAEAWMRMGFGFVIGLLLLVALTPGADVGIIIASSMIIFVGILMAAVVGMIHMTTGGKVLLTLGVAIGMGALFGPVIIFGTEAVTPAVSIFFLALAFFATMPEREEPKEGEPQIVITIGKKLGKSVAKLYGKDNKWKLIGDGYFLGLVLMAGVPIVTSWVSGQLALVVGLVWIMSLFVGYTGGREGRPAIGVIMLFFAIFAFSFQFTGTVGVAVFGGYWPAVYNAGTMVLDPLTAATDSAGMAVGDAWLAVTCPSCYQAELEYRKKLESGIKEGGTTKALELANFKAFSYISQENEIDPATPLVGYVELENRGEFTANRVKVKLEKPVEQDPTKFSMADPHRDEVTLVNDNCIFTECTASDRSQSNECEWFRPSYPEDIKMMQFKCGRSPKYDRWSDDISSCACHERDTYAYVVDATCKAEDACKGKSRFDITTGETYDCGTDGDNCWIVYKKAGWFVKVPFVYEFDYTVNASLDVEVMNKELFIRKLLNKEFRSAWQDPKIGLKSIYSGGPLQLSIHTIRQPLRDDESTLASVGVSNTGTGVVLKDGAKITLRIPKSPGITMVEKPTKVSATRMEGCDWSERTDEVVLECELGSDLNPESEALYTFSYKFKLDANIPVKDLLYTASADYTYERRDDIQLKIEDVPIQ
ncbi:MAG: MFS transporter [Candidatus Aenigmatarchaeota archaeon]